jgi:hypothetical protein
MDFLFFILCVWQFHESILHVVIAIVFALIALILSLLRLFEFFSYNYYSYLEVFALEVEEFERLYIDYFICSVTNDSVGYFTHTNG